jgi:allantoate deiminase
MHGRRDALTAAADMILALERFGRDAGSDTTITVGQIDCRPNRADRIVGEAVFDIDFRTPADDVLARGDSEVRRLLDQVARSRNVVFALEVMLSQTSLEMHAGICAKVRRVAARHCEGGAIESTWSGSAHDASVLAPHVPASMIFVASRDGIAHDPDEFARPGDLALAARVVLDVVKDRRLE